MSDIFYTAVDPNLQIELNARGQAGRYRRNNDQLKFMLEKIANIAIVPYKDAERKQPISEAMLGGTTVRGSEYLAGGPNGFLADRNYTVTEQGIDNGTIKKTVEERINSSRRIPPYITSADITIGDNSMGMLNDASISITVPNPDRDLNFIESVYLRPGRAVKIKFEHPDSAIVSSATTSGLLTSSMASAEKIRTLFPNVTDPELRDYRKMNALVFDGIVKSFTMDYQLDMSVNITLSIIGTSQTYTDISLIMNTTVQNTESAKEKNLYENKIDDLLGIDNSALVSVDGVGLVGAAFDALTTSFSAPPPMPSTIQAATPEQIILDQTELGTFYSNLDKEINEFIKYKTDGTARPTYEQRGYTDQYLQIDAIQQPIFWAVWGTPIDNKLPYQRYIQLSWVIDFINRAIISKRKSADPFATIICTERSNLCVSNYYEHMTSADPQRIWLAGETNIHPDLDTYGDKIWYDTTRGNSRHENNGYIFTETYDEETSKGIISYEVSYPTRVFINMEVIQEICNALEKNNNFTVASLLSSISAEIYYATGNAIDMKLITHPDEPEYLLFYDAKAITLNRTEPVIPYSVPMFSNHEAGTIIRDFKFSGKLPADASNLAYVVNQDPSQIAESDIAPYVAYMYAANTVERSGPHESVGNLITQTELDAIKAKYKQAHESFVETLKQTKIAFGNDITNPEKRAALAQALTKYVQYPKPTIDEANQLTAPVIPFEVEFTIDGVNGFRYGDVLTFDGLPTRYKQNTVFSIMSIAHTVGTDGQWTTTVRCVMRPNIDVQA